MPRFQTFGLGLLEEEALAGMHCNPPLRMFTAFTCAFIAMSPIVVTAGDGLEGVMGDDDAVSGAEAAAPPWLSTASVEWMSVGMLNSILGPGRGEILVDMVESR
jgi:hypothetical protein